MVYNIIKLFDNVQGGLATQCILKGKATQASQHFQVQYFGSVALEVDMKFRGENHYVA